MATGSLLPPQQMTRHSPVAVIEYDRYIDQQIRRTSWQVKLVDLVSRLLTIGVGLLSVLLLAAIVEHWVIPGGLSSWLRWIAFFLIVSLIGWYAIRFLWPLVAMQINPIYSAQTIERQNPQLKNSLLNLLFFRQKREQVPHVVYQAVEQQAALRLSTTSSETAVDRTFLVHTMLVFLGLFVIACLYQVLSPKNPLTTAGRVLLPWADIRTPTRVLIEDLRPQDVEAARGEQIEITAVVRGQRDSEPVLLRFSTEDGQIVEQAIPMTLGKNENQYHGILPQEPPPGRPPGIQQNMRYSIEAGDARTPNYRITLIEQPTITVDRIELDFPAYTLFTRQIQKYQGDIRAIEGTRVTVHAQTNQLFHSGYIDLNSNGRNKVQLNPTDNDSRNVSGSFELTLDADRGTPEFLNYALRFRNQAGQQNRQPIRYRIDTVPDYAPEITILSPTEEVVDVRFSETLLVEIESRDPDFALKHVQILGEIDRETVLKQDLLTEEFVGRFSGIWACIPAKMELQVGDEITYWAEAADNRAPNANISVSKRRRIRVIADLATDQSAEDSQDESSGSQNAEATGSNPSETPDSKKSQPTDSKDTTPTDAKDSEPTDSKDATPTDAKDSEPTDSKDATPTDAKDSEPTDSKDATPTGTQDSEPTDSKDATPTGAQDSQSTNLKDGEGSASQADDRESHGNRGKPSGTGSRGHESDQFHQAHDEPAPDPIDSEGSDDGAAFETIREHLEGQDRRGQQAESGNQEDGHPGQDGSGRREEQEPAGGSEKENPSMLDRTQSPPPASPEDSPGSMDNGAVRPGKKSIEEDSSGQRADDPEPPMSPREGRESDSEGEEGGDRAGGGQEGSGQKTPHDGTGSPGQNEAADDGMGRSADRGPGETSQQSGNKTTSQQKTGRSDQQQEGTGTQQRSGGQKSGGPGSQSTHDQPENGNRDNIGKGGQHETRGNQEQQTGTAEQESGNSRQESEDANQHSKDPGQQGESSQGGPSGRSNPWTGGQNNEKSIANLPADTDPDFSADEANLDYAQKQTNLILDRLSDQLQKRSVDEELLKKLGWSEDDLRRFVERWTQRKRAAQGDLSDAADARRELDENLRSLGLGKRRLRRQQTAGQMDPIRDLRDAYRGTTPPEFQLQVHEYLQGVARDQREE